MHINVQMIYEPFQEGLDTPDKLQRGSRKSIRLLGEYLDMNYPNIVRAPSNLFASCNLYHLDNCDTDKLIDDLRALEFVHLAEKIYV